jgi:DAK2 domain fusion protein YloV
MDALSAPGPFTNEALVACFRRATDTAYRAVRKPVEGTLLTVIREMTEAAEAAVDLDRRAMLHAILAAGRDSVRRTPTLLKVLADAGVVDAGGYGLLVVLEVMIDAWTGEEPVPFVHTTFSHEGHRGLDGAEDTEESSLYTYCTSFLLVGHDLDLEEFEGALAPLGDSLLVVGDDRQIKVHVHTDEPGVALGLGIARGALHEIAIDNMRIQTAARDDRLPPDALAAPVGLTQVVAVVSGRGNERLFRSMGADLLVTGGQSMNPSAEELLRAVASASAAAVVVLPNNKNIIMTAEQVAALADRDLHVVPTRSMQAGLAALVAFDRGADGPTNARAMSAVLDGVATGSVTRAVRNATVNGVAIAEGTFIGLVDDEVVTSGTELNEVVGVIASHLIDDSREVMTLLVGDSGGDDGVAIAVQQLRERYPEVEIEVHEGGQPLYPLLLSAE